jgi:hypothetical protein
MLKAALPAIPGVNLLPGIRKHGGALPDLTLTRDAVPVDREHLEAYSRVCEFPLTADLPLTYPHVLAFALHLQVLTDASFPFPAVGTIHLENAITQHRAIGVAETLDMAVSPRGLRPHRKGRVFDLVTEVRSDGELVWEETSTFLRRGDGDASASAGDRSFDEVLPSGVEWRLPGDLGRRYAGVSGDHNPIHLYALTAKAFGFPRQIAHGMWSVARCLAALEGRLPDRVTVEVAFSKPILLPGRVAFGSRRSGDGYAFSLTSPRSGYSHLLGRSAARNSPER